MVGTIPPVRDFKNDGDLQREAELARDQQVQNMFDALGIHYPGGYRSRLPQPYQSAMGVLSRAREAGGSSLSGVDGLKLADVALNIFPEMAFGKGHAGVAVDGDPSTGFYPVDRSNWISQGIGHFMPGQARRDDMSQEHTSRTYKTTPVQDAAMRRYIEQHARDEYNLYRNNCLDWARQVLRAGGINTKDTGLPIPNDFFEEQR